MDYHRRELPLGELAPVFVLLDPMNRAARVCSTPGCINLIHGRGSLCDQHARQARQSRDRRSSRPTASQRGYDAAWRRVRRAFVEAHPSCVVCGAATEHVDHVIPIAKGGARLAWSNLRAFCETHHNRHTAANGGGFGNAVKG